MFITPELRSKLSSDDFIKNFLINLLNLIWLKVLRLNADEYMNLLCYLVKGSKQFILISGFYLYYIKLSGSKCMDETTCFPLAFGVPAVFMILAVISFVLASKWYVKVPPLGNPIVDVAKVTWVGNIKTNISEKIAYCGEKCTYSNV